MKPLECPKCSATIGLKSFLAAGLPWSAHCPSCEARFKPGLPTWLEFVIVFLYIILLIGALMLMIPVSFAVKISPYLAFVSLIPVILWILLAAAGSWDLMRRFNYRFAFEERSTTPRWRRALQIRSVWIPAAVAAIFSLAIHASLLLPVRTMFTIGAPADVHVSTYGNTLAALMPVLFGCCLLVPLGLLVSSIRNFRADFFQLLACLLVYTAVFVPFYTLVSDAKSTAMEAAAERSKPLIAAIKKYSADHGSPPDKLKDLIPKYLNEIPTPGCPAYPKYIYKKPGSITNPWELQLPHASTGSMFERVYYLPKKNYGRWDRRIGEWAYWTD